MPDMIIFGAGASSGSDIFNIPPPASDLVDELISFQPHSWGQIEPCLLSLFREDFEKGMKKLSQKNPRSMAQLQRAMAEFFFRFAPSPDNLYRKLARRIRQSGWDGVLASFNYERLLELSLAFEGLQPVTGVPQTPNQIEVCLPHGCCHLFGESVEDSASAIPFNGGTAGTEEPVRAVFEPDEFRARICYGAFPPIMSCFDRKKRNTCGVSFIAAQRNRFEEAVLICSRIAIIGLKVRPRDKHIWGPLAQTSARIIYCSREAAAKRFKNWARKWRSGTDKLFDGDFDKHFDDICNELDIGSKISTAVRRAGLRPKARKQTWQYTKARRKTKVRAQTEERARAEAEEKAKASEEAETRAQAEAKARAKAEEKAKAKKETQARAKAEAKARAKAEEKAKAGKEAQARAKAEEKAKLYAEQIAAARAKASEMIAKFKAEAVETITSNVKSESKKRTRLCANSIAQAETRLRAETQEKIKSYDGEIAKIKTEATETIADQRAKLEAEVAKTIARVKAEAVEAIARVRAGAEETVAEQKAKAESEARLRAEAEQRAGTHAAAIEEAESRVESEAKLRAETQEKIKSYSGEIAKIKAEATETIANQRAKSEAEVAKTIARVNAAVDRAAKVKTKFEERSRQDAKAKAAETVSDGFGSAIEKKHAGPTTRKKLPFNNIGALLAIRAKNITQKDIVWGTGDDSVEDALTKMQERDTGYMMIGRDGLLEGIVSKSDLTGALSPYLRSTFAKWHQPVDDATLQIKIKWIMSRPVQTIRSDTSLAVIMKNMHLSDGRCLPVVNEQGKVEGLVTVFDVFKALLKSNPDVSTAGKTLRVPPLLTKLKAAGQGQKPACRLDTAHVPC